MNVEMDTEKSTKGVLEAINNLPLEGNAMLLPGPDCNFSITPLIVSLWKICLSTNQSRLVKLVYLISFLNFH
jgi:hypothetical protein